MNYFNSSLSENKASTMSDNKRMKPNDARYQPTTRFSGKLGYDLGKHESNVNAVVITPDGRIAASAAQDKTIKVWNLATRQCLRELEGHKRPVLSIGISPDGKTLMSGSEGGEIRFWNVVDGSCTIPGDVHCFDVWAIAISRDGHTGISGSLDKTIIWNIAAQVSIKVLAGSEDTDSVVAITPSAHRAVSSYEGGILKVLDLPSGICIHELDTRPMGVTCIAIDDAGHYAITGMISNSLKVWDIDHERVVRLLKGHSALPTSVSMTGDGGFAASGSYDCSTKLWDIASGYCIRTMRNHREAVSCVNITPDGHLGVSGSWDGTIKSWMNPFDLTKWTRLGANLSNNRRFGSNQFDAVRRQG